MFFDQLQQLCKEKDVSMTKVVTDIGMNKSAVTYWRKSGTTPKMDVVQKIADYLDVSASYFLEEEKTSPADLTEDDETIIIRQSLKDRPYRKVVFYVDPRVSEEDIADAIEKIEALALVKELKESGKLPDALK